MTAPNDIVRYSRNIVANSLANEKIEQIDLNLLCSSAAPYLSEADRDVVDLLAYCHSKNGITSLRNVYDSCNNEPRLTAAVTNAFNVFPKELTHEVADAMLPEKAREGLLAALLRESVSQFPVQVMTGFAGDFARESSRLFESPPQFFYMSALTCLGSAVSDKLTLDIGLPIRPRLYTLLLGESADDRKSTAIDMTIEFFREVLNEQFEVCFGLGSAEGLQKRLEKNNRQLLMFDEFKAFVSKCGIDGSTLLPCVNTLFESPRYSINTKHSNIEIANAHVSLLAASTVDTYNSCWKSQFVDIGFNNRLWIVPGGAKRRYSLPPKMDPIVRHRLRKELLEVLSHVERCSDLSVTPAAREMYHDWYLNGPKGVHSKRLDTYANRLMALLAANDQLPEVDEAIVNKAILLCNNQHDVRRRYDPVDADNEVAAMEVRIRRVVEAGPASTRDIKNKVNYRRKGVWVFQTALTNLLKMGEIENDKATGGYRKATDAP